MRVNGRIAPIDGSPRGRRVGVLQSEVAPSGFRDVASASVPFVDFSTGYGYFGQAGATGSQNNEDSFNLNVNSYYE